MNDRVYNNFAKVGDGMLNSTAAVINGKVSRIRKDSYSVFGADIFMCQIHTISYHRFSTVGDWVWNFAAVINAWVSRVRDALIQVLVSAAGC